MSDVKERIGAVTLALSITTSIALVGNGMARAEAHIAGPNRPITRMSPTSPYPKIVKLRVDGAESDTWWGQAHAQLEAFFTPSELAETGAASATNVVLTYVSQSNDGLLIEASGHIPEIEDGGICTLRLSNDAGDVLEVKNEALANESNTSCRTLIVPTTQLSAGTWEVQLAYESETHLGASESQEVVLR